MASLLSVGLLASQDKALKTCSLWAASRPPGKRPTYFRKGRKKPSVPLCGMVRRRWRQRAPEHLPVLAHRVTPAVHLLPPPRQLGARAAGVVVFTRVWSRACIICASFNAMKKSTNGETAPSRFLHKQFDGTEADL